MSEYENMRRDYDRMRAAEEEKLRQRGRVEVLQELRKLVEYMRHVEKVEPRGCCLGVVEDVIGRLESLLARAEDPEQSARERLGRFLATHPGYSYDVTLDGMLIISFGEDPEFHGSGTWAEACNAALDAAEARMVRRDAVIIDLAEGKEPT